MIRPIAITVVAVLAFVITLAGCATTPPLWYKDGSSQEQFSRDKIQCQQLGMASASANGLNGNMFVEIWIVKETNSCLQTLGYHH